MAYLFIVLSAACSLLIAHLLKASEVKKLRTIHTLTVNYLFAGIIAVGLGWFRSSQISIGPGLMVIGFCAVVGIFFISNFVVYSKSVHTNGVGVTITAMRLSLLIPVVVSIYLYDESLDIIESGGVLLVFVALGLLIPKKSNIKIGEINAGWLLLIIFVLSGFADVSLKIYKEEFSGHLNELLFMGFVFLAAFLIGITICTIKKGPLFQTEEWKMGAFIGLPNLYSSIFLIYALDSISGSIAYPIVNMLSVAGGTALGLIRWKDTVSRLQWIGLGIALIAIIILL